MLSMKNLVLCTFVVISIVTTLKWVHFGNENNDSSKTGGRKNSRKKKRKHRRGSGEDDSPAQKFSNEENSYVEHSDEYSDESYESNSEEHTDIYSGEWEDRLESFQSASSCGSNGEKIRPAPISEDVSMQSTEPVHDQNLTSSSSPSSLSSSPEAMSSSWIVLPKQDFNACTRNDHIQQMWTEVAGTTFEVRGLRYMQDKIKVPSAPAACKLVHVDLFRVQHRCDHIARKSRVKKLLQEIHAAEQSDSFVFIVNLQVPGITNMSIVMYWTCSTSSSPSSRARNSKFQTLFNRFLESDDAYRNDRFKLIPRIVEGPWSVKKLVGSKPALLGQKLTQRYFIGDNYAETDVDIGSSMVANKIVSMCRSYSKSLEVDLAIVLQGEAIQELPERVLGCVRLSHLDFSAAADLC